MYRDWGEESVVGTTFESSITQPDTNNPSITMVKHPNGKWLPLKINTTVYTEIVTIVVPSTSNKIKSMIVEYDDGTKEFYSCTKL